MTPAIRPHNGALLLFLGILSTLCSCFPLGIATILIARRDLAAMRVGEVDEAGRSSTQIGMALGILGTILGVAAVVGYFVLKQRPVH